MKISFSSDKKGDAAIENNVKLPYAASKRAVPQFRWFLILLIVSSPFIILLGKMLLDWLFVTSPGTIWMEKKTVNSIEAGTVEKVFYHRGDVVPSDAVLLRVKRKLPEARMEQIALLEAERDAVSQAEGTNPASLGVPVRDVSREIILARQSIDYYEQARNNAKRLMEQGAGTRAELDSAENRLREAKASLASLVSLSSVPAAATEAPTVSPVRTAQIEQSIKSLKKMTEEYFDIKAGQGGKVSSLFVSDGQSFSGGEPLAVVVNTEKVHVVTYVDPNDFKHIKIGTIATIKMHGTGRKVKAVVEQPPVSADNVPSGISEKLYPITMRGVQLYLKVLDPLQEEELIDGLPVVVEW